MANQQMLTRQEMETAINSGSGVLYNGHVITKVDDLPTEVDLAQGDTAREQAALENLLAQQRAIESQIARLAPSAPPVAQKPTSGGASQASQGGK